MARYNVSKSEAKKYGIKRYKISGGDKDKKDKDSSSEKKAKKETEKYYKEEKGAAESQAKTYTERLTEDLNRIYEEAGIAKTRAIEDYNNNIGKIKNERKTGLEDLDYYVKTSTERTGEDLDTALANETRRFSIEQDQINRGLASAGLTFSDRKPEKIAAEGSAIQKAAIQTEADRSFADISRYEFTKNRDIELKYGQDVADEKTGKKRTIENINKAISSSETAIGRQKEDISTGLADTLRALERGEKVDVGQIGMMYDQLNLNKQLSEQEYNALG